VSRQGRLKRQKRFSEVSSIRVPDGDEVGWVVRTDTRKTVTFYTNLGSAYVLRVDDITQTTGYGDPIQAQFSFGDGERIVGVVANDPKLLPEPAEVDLEGLAEDDPRPPFGVGIASDGKALRFPLSAHAEVSTKSGRKYMSVPGLLEVVAVFPCSGAENVAIASRDGRVLLFPVHEIPPRAGAARGVNAIKLGDKDSVLGFKLVTAKRDGLVTYTNRGRELIVRETSYRVTKRGGRGQEVIRLGKLERCEWPPIVLAPGQQDDDAEEETEGDDPQASMETDS
jgi:DNA gyrase subunit A